MSLILVFICGGIPSVYTLMKIFIVKLFLYYFFVYPLTGVGNTHNQNGINSFCGSKMPSLILVIACQDYLDSLAWTGHEVHIAIPGSWGEYVLWKNFLDVLPHSQGLSPLFTGFHTLDLYVHKNVTLAFGTPEKAIFIKPIFAQWIQSAHGQTSYGFDVLLSSAKGLKFNVGRSIRLLSWLNGINENSNSFFLTKGLKTFGFIMLLLMEKTSTADPLSTKYNILFLD
ncbi:LOW QUALITY PROTEIN: hypothetical protein Cgig2_001292 [Carnegiea gigantea]|uniref:Uncharacterized protein n=1 Tax=Carnegiea gigantea TaxID=171969 RepID=A0A9Q1KNC6_9CARY|nr:LOW QUALITY PROTEIN: hypothetical protein Cgig2_001292 [Carnegiea gigantea]